MCEKVTESGRNPRSLLVSDKSEVADPRRTPVGLMPVRQPRLPILGKRDYRLIARQRRPMSGSADLELSLSRCVLAEQVRLGCV